MFRSGISYLLLAPRDACNLSIWNGDSQAPRGPWLSSQLPLMLST